MDLLSYIIIRKIISVLLLIFLIKSFSHVSTFCSLLLLVHFTWDIFLLIQLFGLIFSKCLEPHSPCCSSFYFSNWERDRKVLVLDRESATKPTDVNQNRIELKVSSSLFLTLSSLSLSYVSQFWFCVRSYFWNDLENKLSNL